MATPGPAGGDYDAYSREYAVAVAAREEGGAGNDPNGILPSLLDWLGDLRGQQVLDAGCGEGYLARVLADRGAQVTGMPPAGPGRLSSSLTRSSPGER